MTESEWIDKFLNEAKSGRLFTLGDEVSGPEYQASLTVERYQLLIRQGHLYSLTIPGEQVINAGGFEKWKASNEKREKEVHQATVDAGRSAKRSFRLSILVSILSIIPIALSVLQYLDSKAKDEKIESLQKKITSLELSIKSTIASVQLLKSSLRKTISPAPLLPMTKKKK